MVVKVWEKHSRHQGQDSPAHRKMVSDALRSYGHTDKNAKRIANSEARQEPQPGRPGRKNR